MLAFILATKGPINIVTTTSHGWCARALRTNWVGYKYWLRQFSHFQHPNLQEMATGNPDPTGQPLFIVDRDWLRQGPKARKSWTGNVRNRSLYGLAIEVTQYDVPGTAGRRKLQTKPRKKRRDKQSDATDSESQGEPERSLQHRASWTQAQQEQHPGLMTAHQDRASSVGDDANVLDNARGLESWPENPALHPPISSGFPGLKCIRGLECYLDYCESRLRSFVIH